VVYEVKNRFNYSIFVESFLYKIFDYCTNLVPISFLTLLK